jgi:flagellar hook-associated protein 2
MAVNFVSALGAGSGIDIKKLAEDLVAVERAPRQERIDARIAQAEARISGYSVVRFALSGLKDAFAALNDLSEFSSITPRTSQPSAFSVTPGAGAPSGSFDVTVRAIATAQRVASGGFAESGTALNGGAGFDLQLDHTDGRSTTLSIAAADASPAGVVRTINSTPGLGVTAQLINVGGRSPYKIVLTGDTGAANGFRISSTAPDLSFDTSLQDAADAELNINGLVATRPTNTITDLVEGLSFELYTPTSGSARLDLNRDTSAVRGKITALATAYNEFEETLKELANRDSDIADLGGVLAGDLLVQKLRTEARRMLTSDSSTPGQDISALRNLGLSIDRDGVMQVDGVALDAALRDRFDQVAQMFTGNTEGRSAYSPDPAGLAGDAVRRLDTLMRSSGDIDRQTQSAKADIDRQKLALQALESRMARSLERYTRQFAVMEAIVGESNSLRTSMESTYEGLMAMYTRR